MGIRRIIHGVVLTISMLALGWSTPALATPESPANPETECGVANPLYIKYQIGEGGAVGAYEANPDSQTVTLVHEGDYVYTYADVSVDYDIVDIIVKSANGHEHQAPSATGTGTITADNKLSHLTFCLGAPAGDDDEGDDDTGDDDTGDDDTGDDDTGDDDTGDDDVVIEDEADTDVGGIRTRRSDDDDDDSEVLGTKFTKLAKTGNTSTNVTLALLGAMLVYAGVALKLRGRRN